MEMAEEDRMKDIPVVDEIPVGKKKRQRNLQKLGTNVFQQFCVSFILFYYNLFSKI